MYRDCCVALPHDATVLTAVCGFGISWSYSLTILVHVCRIKTMFTWSWVFCQSLFTIGMLMKLGIYIHHSWNAVRKLLNQPNVPTINVILFPNPICGLMFKPSSIFSLTVPSQFLWILFVIYVLCLFFQCCLVCSLQSCYHLLGKAWPLGSLVCCVLWCVCHFAT